MADLAAGRALGTGAEGFLVLFFKKERLPSI
jgi:galactokinase/mevalonate kinase-like predicted kinase